MATTRGPTTDTPGPAGHNDHNPLSGKKRRPSTSAVTGVRRRFASSAPLSPLDSAPPPEGSVDRVIEYILAEMLVNSGSEHVAFIRDKLDAFQWDNLIPGKYFVDTIQAYHRWYTLVKTGGAWDHKRDIIQKFGKWSHQDLWLAVISYQFDIWSNIHYGYVGLAAGFPEWDLLSGAGVAQIKEGLDNVPDGYWKRRFEEFGDADVFTAFDDPKDMAAIKIGFALWKAHGRKVAARSILAAVQAAYPTLATRVYTVPGRA